MALIRKIKNENTTISPITISEAVLLNENETLASTFNALTGGLR